MGGVNPYVHKPLQVPLIFDVQKAVVCGVVSSIRSYNVVLHEDGLPATDSLVVNSNGEITGFKSIM